MREAKIRGTFMQIPYWRLRARFRACGYRDKEVAAGGGRRDVGVCTLQPVERPPAVAE